MLSSMLDYSSAMEDALVTKLDKIVFFLHRHIICYINY